MPAMLDVHQRTTVRRSTGFAPYRRRGEMTLDGHAAAVAAECRPLYDRTPSVGGPDRRYCVEVDTAAASCSAAVMRRSVTVRGRVHLTSRPDGVLAGR
jgi:hypothetical protein